MWEEIIGLLRFLLAFAVVLNHNGGVLRYDIVGGPLAVQTFFMISGFLMQLVLSRRYVGRKAIKLFYTNRLARLFPSYLLALAVTFGVAWLFSLHDRGYLAFLHDQDRWLAPFDRALLAITALLIIGQELFLFMVHTPNGVIFSTTGIDPLVWPLQPVPQAWSLSLELYFYAIVPLLVPLSTRRLATLALLLLAARIALSLAGLPHDPWSYRFFPSALPVFLAGMLAYRLREKVLLVRVSPAKIGATFLALSLLVHPAAFALRQAGITTQFLEYAYLAGAFIAIPALFQADLADVSERWRRHDATLGELSYPIYITHWIGTAALGILLPSHDVATDTLRATLSTIITLLLSVGLLVAVERPIERWRSRRAARVGNRSDAGAAVAREVDVTYSG